MLLFFFSFLLLNVSMVQNAVLENMKVFCRSVCIKNPGCYTHLLQPSIFLFWLMKRFNWTMLGACKMLFVYSAASEQTNKHRPAEEHGYLKQTDLFAQPFYIGGIYC